MCHAVSQVMPLLPHIPMWFNIGKMQAARSAEATGRRHHEMKLAEARRRAGYSTQAFAAATGASTRTISELERGKRLPQPRTMRAFAETLGVAVEEVDEFRETIRREASKGAPEEVLDQAEHMEELFEVELVDASFIRAAARRSLKEVMEYLVRSGHAEDVDRVYREVRGEDAGQKGPAKRKPLSSGADAGSEGTKPYAE